MNKDYAHSMQGDLISRQDAIERATKEHDFYKGATIPTDKARRDELLNVMCWLGELPSAQPEPQWIPVKARPMDEEERAEWSEKLGYDIEYEEALIYTSQLPDDGQEVLTCSRYGTVRIDRFENDPDYGCSFEENGDMDGIVAWMPLPKPWKGEQE